MCGAGLALLGHIDEKFVEVVDVYEPLESGQRDKCYISKGCAPSLILASATMEIVVMCWLPFSTPNQSSPTGICTCIACALGCQTQDVSLLQQ